MQRDKKLLNDKNLKHVEIIVKYEIVLKNFKQSFKRVTIHANDFTKTKIEIFKKNRIDSIEFKYVFAKHQITLFFYDFMNNQSFDCTFDDEIFENRENQKMISEITTKKFFIVITRHDVKRR